MKKRKTALALLLLGSVFTATGKDAGWQWYNETRRTPEDDKSSSTQPQQASPDIMEKLATLQQATKRAMYEAILYPGVENFTRYFRLQNYWTQQAGLFSMSAKKAMLEHPELDYNLQHSHYNGTVRNQLAADFADQRRAIETLAQHYGVMFFYRGQDPIDGQLVQVIKKAIPAGARKDGPHPAKRTFQAIRIEVNDELGILKDSLEHAAQRLKRGGRLCVITFHSLEDRIAKQTLRLLATDCICPPDMPVCTCHHQAILKVKRQPILPSPEELDLNPRARSAKLRVGIRK